MHRSEITVIITSLQGEVYTGNFYRKGHEEVKEHKLMEKIRLRGNKKN